MANEEPLQRTGRGGAGNFRRLSTDPDQTSTAKGIVKELKDSASSIFNTSKDKSDRGLEYVHHGRGGAGNLSTTSAYVKPVQSLVNPKTELKPAKGRGGAGNIGAASEEEQRSSLDGRVNGGTTEGKKVVNVPAEGLGNMPQSSDGTAAAAGGSGSAANGNIGNEAVAQPAQVHLGEGREVVHDGGA